MLVSKTELIEVLEKEGIVYADRSDIDMIEFAFDNSIDLGFFSLSCDYRGYVKCFLKDNIVSIIEATTAEGEIPEDITKMNIP